jgi:hypothetical protein
MIDGVSANVFEEQLKVGPKSSRPFYDSYRW